MKFAPLTVLFLASSVVWAAPAPEVKPQLPHPPPHIQRVYDLLDKRAPIQAKKRNFPLLIGTVFVDLALRLWGLKAPEKKPWDTESGNCVVEVRTKNGGNCVAAASPAGEPAFTDFADWNVCFLNGQQYFTFPDAPGRASVGDVMIEFTAAGGVDGFTGDGLRNPRVSFNSLNPPVVMNFWELTGSYHNRDPICIAMLDQREGPFGGSGRGWDAWKCAVPCKDYQGDWSINTK